jgi:hypothetical protein
MKLLRHLNQRYGDNLTGAGHRPSRIVSRPPPSTGTNYNLVDGVEHAPNERVIWKIIRSPDGHFVYDYRLKSRRRKRRKRCSGCGGFLEPGQRKCFECQSETRKARNRRHYQVLKTRFKTGSS